MADYNSSYTGAEIDAAIGKAQSIEANPTLAGTESSLTGLQIGSTKYKVDGGSGKADKTDLTSIIATGSTNTTGATITSGTYFYLNGTLVQAKADIASGATFTSGTNYEAVTAGGLNDLKSAFPQSLSADGLTAQSNCTIVAGGTFRFGNFVFLNLYVWVTTASSATTAYISLSDDIKSAANVPIALLATNTSDDTAPIYCAVNNKTIYMKGTTANKGYIITGWWLTS